MSLLDLIAPPLCAGCGAHAGRTEPLCAQCRSRLRWLGPEPVTGPIPAWAPLAYEGPAQGVVRALKFKGATRVAGAMAAQIAANAPPGWLEPGRTALVPVPLHPSRARKRGYNQARLLAEALSERTGMPVADCLERSGAKGTQVGRTRAQRLRGIAGELRLSAEPPPHALLVDDVITTGATLAACARVLPGGTRAIAYARTPGR